MPKKGRPRLTSAELRARGNKSAPIRAELERQTAIAQGKLGELPFPAKPARLRGRSAEVWDEFEPLLRQIGGVLPHHVVALEGFCEALAHWRALMNRPEKTARWLSRVNAFRKQADHAAKALGIYEVVRGHRPASESEAPGDSFLRFCETG